MSVYSPPQANRLSGDYKYYSVTPNWEKTREEHYWKHYSQFVDEQHTSQLDGTSTVL